MCYFVSLHIRCRAFVNSDFILKFLTGRFFFLLSLYFKRWSDTLHTRYAGAARRGGSSASVRPRFHSAASSQHVARRAAPLAARDHAPIRSLLLLRYITDQRTLGRMREGDEHCCTCCSLWPNRQISHYLVFLWFEGTFVQSEQVC